MFELRFHCISQEAETFSTLLETVGALSITLTDRQDHPILEPELGTAPLWPEIIITALFDSKEQAEFAQQLCLKKFPQLETAVEKIPEEDWERTCLSDFKPLQFGKHLWICPSWLSPPDPKAINLILDPGLAFGTGTHQTTSLCLEWLATNNLNQLEAIDYGCGSGILALAALKLGAKIVYAVDIDPQALVATKNNALNNHLANAQLIIDTPEKLTTPVDLIIANILLSPLLSLKTRFHHLLEKNGILVISGILKEQIPELIEIYKDTFKHIKTNTLEGWGLVVFSRLAPQGPTILI